MAFKQSNQLLNHKKDKRENEHLLILLRWSLFNKLYTSFESFKSLCKIIVDDAVKFKNKILKYLQLILFLFKELKKY